MLASTLSRTCKNVTLKTPGAAANQACTRKELLYAEMNLNHNFIPFAVETFRNYSDAAKTFVQILGRILIDRYVNVHAAHCGGTFQPKDKCGNTAR